LTPLIAGTGWSPLDSRADLKYFAQSIVGHNINTTLTIILGFGPVVALGVVVLAMGCLRSAVFRREYAVFALVSTLMISGYCVVLIESRYVWAVAFLATMGLALWLSTLQRAKLLSGRQILLAGTLVCLVAVLTTTQNVVRTHDSQAYQNHAALARAYTLVPEDSKIIADTFSSYTECYYFRLHCYGALTPPSDSTAAAYYLNLKQLGIGYYVDYHTKDDNVALRSFVARYFTRLGDRPVGGKVVTFYAL
jgi:hypothetical protein